MMKVFFRNPTTKVLEYIATISAQTLDETFLKTQNLDKGFPHGYWPFNGYVRHTAGTVNGRSSSVGDVFLNDFGEAFIVAPSGFLRYSKLDNIDNDTILEVDTFELVMGCGSPN